MLRAGQRISEYVLEERLGGGAFGEVWRAAHHVWIDQKVAVKVPTDAAYIRHLRREGTSIHGLSHPNIVRPIGMDPFADPPYLVMEYVPGVNLREVIERRGTEKLRARMAPSARHVLPMESIVQIVRQMLLGLAHAHERGLVHCDMKPENVLVHRAALEEGFEAPGTVRLTDFGLGTRAPEASGSILISAEMERGAAIAGTLDYMAPEARQGQAVDRRADLYAVGVILHELLTGERPAGTEMPSERNPSVPKYLDEAFRRSYARLERRFASAEEFMAAIEDPSPQPWYAGAGSSRPHPACPRCRRAVDATDQFCMHCGVQLVAHPKRCPRCRAFPAPTDKFCMRCGSAC
jgi:serine/threonine-protein kinase